jgi:hypothetical protein
MTTTQIDIVQRLLNKFYDPDTFGYNLKQHNLFVKIIIQKLKEGLTEEEILKEYMAVDTNVWHDDYKPKNKLLFQFVNGGSELRS